MKTKSLERTRRVAPHLFSMASQVPQQFHWHYSELDDKNFQVNGRSLLCIVIIFSLLLLFTLLCLYARWVFRYRRFNTSELHANTISQLSSDGSASAGGLDAATIESLPVLLHRSSMGEETQCSICLSAFQEEEKVKVLPQCHHGFHPECVGKWLMQQSSCPLCRDSLEISPV